MRRLGSLLLPLLLVPNGAWPQGMPVGPEFRVNTYTTGEQRSFSVASDAAGNFVVAWWSTSQDGSSSGVFGQRYDSTGAPLGPEFLVNTYTTDTQCCPQIASAPSGNFVVVWPSAYQDGSGYGVFGQRYDSSGGLLGPEFRVNTYTTGSQDSPTVASDSSGNFVVVWSSFAQDGSERGVFGQRFSNSGIPLGPEFRVNSYTTGFQGAVSVASGSSGSFVVVWADAGGQDGDFFGIFGQRFASSGTPVGPEFQVNTYTTGVQLAPSVVSDASGNFVVVWSDREGQDGEYVGVFGQRYDGSGARLGSEFRVNSNTTGNQNYPSVAGDPSGNFVVVWQSFDNALGYGVFGQRYASSGTPLGGEFLVNTHTTGYQGSSRAAANASGEFVVVWTSTDQDGSGNGVFGQRFGQITPVELSALTVE